MQCNAIQCREVGRCWAVFLPSEHLIRRPFNGDELRSWSGDILSALTYSTHYYHTVPYQPTQGK